MAAVIAAVLHFACHRFGEKKNKMKLLQMSIQFCHQLNGADNNNNRLTTTSRALSANGGIHGPGTGHIRNVQTWRPSLCVAVIMPHIKIYLARKTFRLIILYFSSPMRLLVVSSSSVPPPSTIRRFIRVCLFRSITNYSVVICFELGKYDENFSQ